MELHILQIAFCMLSIHYSLQYVVQFMQVVYIFTLHNPVDAPSSQFKSKFSSFTLSSRIITKLHVYFISQFPNIKDDK